MMLKQTIIVLGLGVGLAVGFTATAAPPREVVALAYQTPVRPQQPTELVLELTNPNVQPKIGIPDFLAPGGDAELQAAAKILADVLGADLDFEREFLVVDRKTSAAIPAAATPEAILYDRWRELGADFVVFATMRRSGGEFIVDLKVLRVRGDRAGEQRFGSEYSNCTLSNPRYCAHFIADDMHLKLRQLVGVARTKIAFASDRDASRTTARADGNPAQGKEIYIADYDGANQRQATANRALNIAPSWLSNARGLAYTSYVTRFPDIYVSLFDGRAPMRPAGGTEQIHNQLPAPSPDGQRLAFASSRLGRMDVFVVNRDGSGLQNLTPNTPNSDDSAPAWSPGGNQIAFTSDRTGSNQIYVMSADGLGVKKLTSGSKADRPTWSSLNYIAYSVDAGPGNDIAVYDFRDGQVKILTDGHGSNASPTVAPNGRHIAFVTTRWGREQVAIIDYPTGKTVRRVTDSGNNTYPNWSPSPGGTQPSGK